LVEPTLQDQIATALSDAYTIERELGGGGMSRLFLARDRALERLVVIKVLPPEFAAGVGTERFRREIVMAAQLQHANIVPLLTAGEAAGHPYFIMPYIEGESLRRRLERGGLGMMEIITVLRDVARALAYAHERGIVHRDIKPDNVLVSGGAAMVSDFGVAKALSSAARSGPQATLTFVGTSLGTPAYMAPEQVAADPGTDHRADLYAFGIVGYELLAGHPPFHNRTPQATLTAHLTETPRPLREVRPELPANLAAVIERCLEKDPELRPASASVIGEALESPSGSTMVLPRRAATRKRRLVVAGAAVLGLAAIALAATFFRAESTPATPAVAVLPLVDLGGADEYFADGMTDELTNALSELPGVRVASRTSAFTYKGRRDVDARQIGDQLSVTHLVEGTVRKEGDQLRVSARLTSTRDGLTVWSSSYQRELEDVFAVQEEVARAIAGALEVQLVGNQQLVHRGTDDLEAYDLYLRGRHFWRQRGSDGLRKAAELFGQATARDPDFAAAHAGYADALGLLPLYGPTPFDSVIAPARAAAERAIRLDSSLAEGHATLGQLLRNTGAWKEAESHLRQAIALDSSYAPAYQWLGEVMYLNGRVDESLETLHTAARLDPLSPIIAMVLSYVYSLAGDLARSDSMADRALELAPDAWPVHAFIGAAALESKRPDRAITHLERAARLTPALPSAFRGLLAYAYANSGRRAEAVAIRDELVREKPQSAIGLAEVHIALGNREESLAMLERALAERDPFLYAASISPEWYASLRGEPRFRAVAERMGLDPRSWVDPS
jgi:eukaryotic-like serine/threonine-protein kinase